MPNQLLERNLRDTCMQYISYIAQMFHSNSLRQYYMKVALNLFTSNI